MPIVLPSIIVGVGLFYLYSRIGLLHTSVGLVLGHTIFALPYVVVTTMSCAARLLTTASTNRLDAGPTSSPHFAWFHFPLMKAGMAMAFLFAFVHSFDELSVALFVSGQNAPTLPKRLVGREFSTSSIHRLRLPLRSSSSSSRCRSSSANSYCPANRKFVDEAPTPVHRSIYRCNHRSASAEVPAAPRQRRRQCRGDEEGLGPDPGHCHGRRGRSAARDHRCAAGTRVDRNQRHRHRCRRSGTLPQPRHRGKNLERWLSQRRRNPRR